MSWHWPLIKRAELPRRSEPGAFGAKRSYDRHTGVDLYCSEGDVVTAVEKGIVIAFQFFTGKHAGSPWWRDTCAMRVHGKSGAVLYGEMEPLPSLRLGTEVQVGQPLGRVQRVLKNDKGRPCEMLHLELYKPDADAPVWWKTGERRPKGLLDPTKFLIAARKRKL